MTPHFKLSEFTRSKTAEAGGIKNIPPADVLPHLQRLAEGLERIRAMIGGCPIVILSGYRSPELNKAVGGVANSQHVKGQAADIIAPTYGSVHNLARAIDLNSKALGVDQVIKERNSKGSEWVHVSFTLDPRYQALTITSKGVQIGIV